MPILALSCAAVRLVRDAWFDSPLTLTLSLSHSLTLPLSLSHSHPHTSSRSHEVTSSLAPRGIPTRPKTERWLALRGCSRHVVMMAFSWSRRRSEASRVAADPTHVFCTRGGGEVRAGTRRSTRKRGGGEEEERRRKKKSRKSGVEGRPWRSVTQGGDDL